MSYQGYHERTSAVRDFIDRFHPDKLAYGAEAYGIAALEAIPTDADVATIVRSAHIAISSARRHLLLTTNDRAFISPMRNTV